MRLDRSKNPSARPSTRTSAVLLSFVAILALPAGRAFAADNCKGVNITVENGTTDQIKVTKFEYNDFDKQRWRLEPLLGVDGKEKLNARKSFTVTRDLEGVKNDKTQFKVWYRHKIGGVKFEDEIFQLGEIFVCQPNSSHSITVTK